MTYAQLVDCVAGVLMVLCEHTIYESGSSSASMLMVSMHIKVHGHDE